MVEFDRTRMLSALARQNEGYARRDPIAIRNSTLDAPSRIFKELYLIAMILEDVAGSKRVRRLLEVGCGLGAMTPAFHLLADTVVGIDLSEAAVATASDRLSGFAALDIAQADGTDPQASPIIASQKFNLVVFREFHPFTRPFYDSRLAAMQVHQAILAAYGDLLAPNGIILIAHAEYNDQVIRPDRLDIARDFEIAISRVDPRLLVVFLFATRNRLRAAIALARVAQRLLWRFSTRNVLYVLKKRACRRP